MKFSILLIICCLIVTGFCSAQTAEEWLGRVDQNMVYKTAESVSKMTVHLPNGKERIFRLTSKVEEDRFALIEYQEPQRDKGTRYLKRHDVLWIYFPRVDRTMQIQGHMLREGVQGGDMTFEDMTESSTWRDKYNAEITGETDSTVTIKMVAKDMTVSYPYREIIIDKATSVPLLTINSGVGDVPIKEIRTIKMESFGDRTFPVISEIRSRLVENKWTRFEVEKIKFGMSFPEETFTKEELEQ